MPIALAYKNIVNFHCDSVHSRRETFIDMVSLDLSLPLTVN
jgi:hypothetical protein